MKLRHRKGQSLVLMMFILVALVVVMALTLDFGFVLLGRRQMQTGVNTAAKEGLRGQGLADFDANDEQQRRENARRVLRLTFDDNYDPVSNVTTMGAGIDSSLVQGNGFRQTTIGAGNTTLGEDLDNRSSFIYRPDAFALNQVNLIHGDMLVGGYDGSDPQHTESSAYARSDFDASGTGAFLLRMRRTHNPDGLDEVAGVSSRGGGLPLLLARMSWLSEGEASGYSIRRDGVTVRATGIADAVPARAVGVADLSQTPTLAGTAPISVSVSGWRSLAEGVTYNLDTENGDIENAGATFVTRATRIDDTQPVSCTQLLSTIAQSWPDAGLLPDDASAVFYLPIHASHTSPTGSITVELILGFGRIQLSRSGAQLTLQRLSQVVAAENAASLPAPDWQDELLAGYRTNPNFAGLSNADQQLALGEFVEAAFQQSTAMAAGDDVLLAPALVRTIR